MRESVRQNEHVRLRSYNVHLKWLHVDDTTLSFVFFTERFLEKKELQILRCCIEQILVTRGYFRIITRSTLTAHCFTSILIGRNTNGQTWYEWSSWLATDFRYKTAERIYKLLTIIFWRIMYSPLKGIRNWRPMARKKARDKYTSPLIWLRIIKKAKKRQILYHKLTEP